MALVTRHHFYRKWKKKIGKFYVVFDIGKVFTNLTIAEFLPYTNKEIVIKKLTGAPIIFNKYNSKQVNIPLSIGFGYREFLETFGASGFYISFTFLKKNIKEGEQMGFYKKWIIKKKPLSSYSTKS